MGPAEVRYKCTMLGSRLPPVRAVIYRSGRRRTAASRHSRRGRPSARFLHVTSGRGRRCRTSSQTRVACQFVVQVVDASARPDLLTNEGVPMARVHPAPTVRRLIISVVFLCSLVVAVPVGSLAADRQIAHSGDGTGDYIDDLVSRSRGAGDPGTGQNGTTPDPDGELIPVEAHQSQINAGQASWLIRLAAFFAWMTDSLFISSTE